MYCCSKTSELQFLDTKLDGDNPDHINWCLKAATERGKQFNISGFTYSLTQGVVKNIIPAIASTNAIIAGKTLHFTAFLVIQLAHTRFIAACANEAYKIATNCASFVNNYMMYVGDQGIYTYTFELQRKEECSVCGSALWTIPIEKVVNSSLLRYTC